MSPFWEDDLPEVLALMGPEHVIFGSDWPHMEGLPAPRDILASLSDVAPDAQGRFLCENTRALSRRRPPGRA